MSEKEQGEGRCSYWLCNYVWQCTVEVPKEECCQGIMVKCSSCHGIGGVSK